MRTRATLVAALLVGTLAACAGARGPAAGETFDSLPDGDHSGFVVGFDGQAITFDPAEMLLDETAPNRFRIENPDDAVLILAVTRSAKVALRPRDRHRADLPAVGPQNPSRRRRFRTATRPARFAPMMLALGP